MMSRTVRRRLACLLAGTVMVPLTGCSDGSPDPVDAVPELGETLVSVDEALSERRFREARAHLDELVEIAAAAREDGDLEPEQADRVLAAALQLISALPESQSTPESEPEGDPEPETHPEPETGQEPDTATEPPPEPAEKEQGKAEKEQEELEKKLEEERKKLEEERKKLEEEQKKEEGEEGHGDSGGNGPDDGEGS